MPKLDRKGGRRNAEENSFEAKNGLLESNASVEQRDVGRSWSYTKRRREGSINRSKSKMTMVFVMRNKLIPNHANYQKSRETCGDLFKAQ
jgi:hypothetical protein